MKIVVFDDDPTGSQAVYGCPLLLRWDQDSLRKGINDPSPLLFVLANTRALPPELAASRTREITKELIRVCALEGIMLQDLIFVSRGDSTLRGHGVLEPDVLNEELGPFDATFHVPAFLEGGRTTIGGIHLLHGKPVHQTPFARDRIFSYSSSDLAFWLQEKSQGRIIPETVARLTIELLDEAGASPSGMNKLIDWLIDLTSNKLVIVDAERHHHLMIFAKAIHILLGKKRFLFRSAASLINVLANLPPNPYSVDDLVALKLRDDFGQCKRGLIMVGSYVPLANHQLKFLLAKKTCAGIELPVEEIAIAFESSSFDVLVSDTRKRIIDQINTILDANMTPVLFTTRGEIDFLSNAKRLSFGIALAEFMANLVVSITPRLGYIISKGGITTHALLTRGFNFGVVKLKGQIMPGLSMVSVEAESDFDNLPIITFPGNLGDETTLLNAWELMENNDLI